MAHITICSDLNNESMITSFGEIQFDRNGEAKLDPDSARQVLAKYSPIVWSKKKGKPEDEVVEEPESEEVDEELEASPAKKSKKKDENFGFDETVYVSKRARKAIANKKTSAAQLQSKRTQAVNDKTLSKKATRNGIEDIVKAGGAIGSAPKKVLNIKGTGSVQKLNVPGTKKASVVPGVKSGKKSRKG